MAQKLKFGNGTWATKEGSTLAYNDENNNFKPLPFTTTRNSIATRVNKQGLIEVVGNDVPRIDYTDSAKGVLLLENSSTNLITYSEDFTQGWTESNSIITSNQVISLDGTLNADKLTKSDINGSVIKGYTFVGGEVFSIFAKADESNILTIDNGDGRSYFNLINGTCNAATGGGYIEHYGNGWYRCTVENSFVGASTIRIYPSDSLTSLSGTTGSLYIWGAMLEANSFSTSYIPTNGSTVQRLADTASGSGNSEVFNDSEGVLFADIAALANDLTNRTIALSDGTTSNTVRIQYLTVSNAIWATVTNIGAGGNQAVLQYTSSDITTNSKVSFRYKENDFSLWVNGFEVATDTSGVTFSANTLNTLQFDRGNGAEDFYGKTKEIGYYDTALTDLELETLTSYRSLNELVTELNLNTL